MQKEYMLSSQKNINDKNENCVEQVISNMGDYKPLISLIIPIFKVPENYLRKCIESVMSQTFSNIEIILVDDGSPDRCGEICDFYAKKDSRIIVIHKKNEGLSAARNTGFFSSHGEWIMFVDGDDWIDEDMCEAMLREGQEKQVDVVMCGIMKEYNNSSIQYQTCLKGGYVYRGLECRWLQQQLLVYNSNIAVAYAKLINRKLLLDKNIIHDPMLRQGAEGLEFNLRLFEAVDSASSVDRPFYHYIYNNESISATHSETNHNYVVKCFEKIKEFIEISNNKDELMPWFNNRVLYVIITTAISGYFSPENKEPYREKKKKYLLFLENPIIHEAMKECNHNGISFQRRVTLRLIKARLFWALCIMGKIRKWQKGHR